MKKLIPLVSSYSLIGYLILCFIYNTLNPISFPYEAKITVSVAFTIISVITLMFCAVANKIDNK